MNFWGHLLIKKVHEIFLKRKWSNFLNLEGISVVPFFVIVHLWCYYRGYCPCVYTTWQCEGTFDAFLKLIEKRALVKTDYLKLHIGRACNINIENVNSNSLIKQKKITILESHNRQMCGLSWVLSHFNNLFQFVCIFLSNEHIRKSITSTVTFSVSISECTAVW